MMGKKKLFYIKYKEGLINKVNKKDKTWTEDKALQKGFQSQKEIKNLNDKNKY